MWFSETGSQGEKIETSWSKDQGTQTSVTWQKKKKSKDLIATIPSINLIAWNLLREDTLLAPVSYIYYVVIWLEWNNFESIYKYIHSLDSKHLSLIHK